MSAELFRDLSSQQLEAAIAGALAAGPPLPRRPPAATSRRPSPGPPSLAAGSRWRPAGH
jgi:hypothetical protein